MNKIIIIASAVAVAISIGGCSEQKSVEQLMASATEYSAKRDFGSAVIELKNAVRLSPKNAEARLALGQAYLALGNYIFAEKELEKSIQLGIEQSSTAPLLAQVKVKLAKYDELEQLVDKSTDLNDNDYIKVLTYAGIGALANNEREKAQDYIGQAISISEIAVYSQIGKAYLAQSEKEYAESLVKIDTLIGEHPKFSEAMLLKAHLLFSLKEFEQAAVAFSNYATDHPFDYSVRFFEISSLIKAKMFDQAEVITDKLLEKFDSAPLALHYKAQLQYQQKNFKEAKFNAEQSIQAGSTLILTKVLAGASAFQLKDYEQAYNYLKPIESSLSNSHSLQKIIAIVKMQLGYGLEAAQDIMSFEGLTSEDSSFLQTSTASLIELGDFESAEKLIEKAESIDPTNAKVAAQKGLILFSQNDERAIDSLERAIELDSTFIEIELALGLQYLKADDVNKAKEIATKLLKLHSENVSGYILQGVILVKEGNKGEAINIFNKALSISPDNIASLYNLALILMDSPDKNNSMGYFEQVIKLVPTHKGALSNYITLAARTDQLERSRNFLQELNENKNLTLSIALAQNLRINNQIKDSIELLENLSRKIAKNTSYWSLLGDLNLQMKLIGKANDAFKEGLKLEPKNYLLNLRSIGILEILEKYPAALAQTKSAYDYYPNDSRLEILLAHFELRNNNIDAAKTMLKIMKQKGIDHHLVDSVFGNISLLERSFERAIEFFSSALEHKKTDENIIQLARALKFNGQQQEAEKLLEDFVDSNTGKVEVRFLLAELYSVENKEKKIKQYQSIVSTNPENFIAFNNLAWNQYKHGQFEAAIGNAEQAYLLAPLNMSILETYGVILVEVRKYNDAVKILEEAISKGSKDSLVEEALTQARTSLKN